jgi:hypothetical protein
MSEANLMNRIVLLKEAARIPCANCSTCEHLGSDGDGWEYNGTWPVCNKIERMSCLKSFPFKKDMKCWEPNFWASGFLEGIEYFDEADKAVDEAYKKFTEAVASVENERAE